MTDDLPGDYTSQDGWNEEQGVEQCPRCETKFTANGGHIGEVYDSSGRRYEHFLDTEAGTGPFFCPDCWEVLETNRKQSENQTLGAFE